MLRVAAVTRKTVDRRTDGHTHTDRQTDCNNPRCACAQASVNSMWVKVFVYTY